MVKRCAWGTCNSDTRYPERLVNGVYFLPFPKPHLNREKCLLWIKLCGRPHYQFNVNKINKDVYICSKHFVNGGPCSEFPNPRQARPTGPTVGQRRRPPPKKRQKSAPRRTKKDRKIGRGDLLWRADGGNCGRPEPARSSDPERNLQSQIEAQIDASTDTGSETEDGADDWNVTRDCLKRVENEYSQHCPEPDVQLLMVKKEELPPEQQERSPYPDQEDHESPLIKEEQEELWVGQGREQLQGLEEVDKVLFTSVRMKSEDDEEEPQSSLLHHRLTDHMETAAGREDCGRPDPARSPDPERILQAEIEVQIEASTDTGSETENWEDDWKETRDCLKRAETVNLQNCPEPGKTNHVVYLTDERCLSCSECGKGFNRQADLGRHMLIHTKEQPFSCPECGKRFNQKGNLNVHRLTHATEKPFSCYKCCNGFSRKSDLGRHMFVHTQEKPYHCSECGKGFNRKDGLTVHMRVHSQEKPYICSVCGKRYKYRKKLTLHMVIHSKEKAHGSHK